MQVLMFLIFIITILGSTTPLSSSVTVSLADERGKPLEGIKISLFLYDFQGASLSAQYMGSCQTNNYGICTILVPAYAPRDSSGFYRGYLTVGHYGRRSVLWPGGDFAVSVWLDASGERLAIPRHGAYEEILPGKALRPSSRTVFVVVFLSLTGVGSALWYWLHRRRFA